MLSRRFGLLVVAALFGVGVVAGCGGETKEAKPPASADDGAPGTEAKETGEDAPAAGKDTKQAKAIVARYIKASNQATSSGDFTEVDKVAAASCATCKRARDNVTKIYRSGGKVEGDLFFKPQIDAGAVKGRLVDVSVMTWLTAYKIIDADGKTVESGDAENLTFLYEVDLGSGKIVKGRDQ